MERERERETKNGVWLLAALKPTKRRGWWKGKFALFQRPVTWGVCVCVCARACRHARTHVQRADSHPKADSLPLTIGGHELLYRPMEEAICRKNTFSSDGHLEIRHVVG